MKELAGLRSEVPRPEPAGLRAEEERLRAAFAAAPAVVSSAAPAARPRKRWISPRLLVAGGLAAAAGAGVLVAVNGSGEDRDGRVVHVMPVAAERVLSKAADNAGRGRELRPRVGQYLVFESRTMDQAEGAFASGYARYLYRTHRKVWYPVKGTSVDGVIIGRSLEPRPYPGWPIPQEAREQAKEPGQGTPERLADFDQRAPFLRTDYAYLSTLPTTPAGMYEHLYTQLGHGPDADAEAWNRVSGMLREAYLPAAQRAALFRAAAAIPGATTVGTARDAYGRTGVAAARNDPRMGLRDEYIFDRKTYQYLGMRTTVTDAAKAKAPVGSVVASSALLKVEVADTAPSPVARRTPG
ncbi:CU044_5270 family protein [Actinomadura viridis]|uniref:CU044_5270 family protein n=1 Tax=Actinomadura viridis TaxID=58110 RepID=UPI00368B5C98